MSRSIFFRILCLVFAASYLVACTTSSPAPTVSPLISPLPASKDQKSATVVSPAFVAPVPEAGKGGIMGRLVAGSSDGPGYFGGDLYLGSLIPASDPSAQPMISFSENVDPKADVYQSDGRFAFNNVQPGNYALVVWTPGISFVVELPNGGGMVQVKVEPGKVTDLGVLVIP